MRIPVIATLLGTGVSFAFVSPSTRQHVSGRQLSFKMLASDEWIDLADDGAIKKVVIEEGTGDVLENGAEVKIDYVGTLLGNDWSAEDVVKCWLSTQQGLDDLADTFLEKSVDGAMLMDDSVFTEDFVMKELGVSNKIKCKKLVMAAKRLSKVKDEFPAGLEFDSNKEKGEPYKFVLGAGKVIKGMDLGVGSMRVGEKSQILCRTDYAYGAEGVRRSNGDVMVPPFAALCFEVTLLE